MSKRKASALQSLDELLYPIAQTIADAKHTAEGVGVNKENDRPAAAAAAAAAAGAGQRGQRGQAGQRTSAIDETKLEGQARGLKRLRIVPIASASAIVEEFEKQVDFKNLYEIIKPAELQSISNEEKAQIIKILKEIRSVAPFQYSWEIKDPEMYERALMRRIYFKRYFQQKRIESIQSVKNLKVFKNFNVPKELQTLMGQYYMLDTPIEYQYSIMPMLDIIDTLHRFDEITEQSHLRLDLPERTEEKLFKTDLEGKIWDMAPELLQQEWQKESDIFDRDIRIVIYSWYTLLVNRIGLSLKRQYFSWT